MVASDFREALAGRAGAGLAGRGRRHYLHALEPLRWRAAQDDGGYSFLWSQRRHRIPSSADSGGSAESSKMLEESVAQPACTVRTGRRPARRSPPFCTAWFGCRPNPPIRACRNSPMSWRPGADLGALRRLNPGWREAGKAHFRRFAAGECAVGSNLAARFICARRFPATCVGVIWTQTRRTRPAAADLSHCDHPHHRRLGRRPDLSSSRRAAISPGNAGPSHARGGQYSRRNP